MPRNSLGAGDKTQNTDILLAVMNPGNGKAGVINTLCTQLCGFWEELGAGAQGRRGAGAQGRRDAAAQVDALNRPGQARPSSRCASVRSAEDVPLTGKPWLPRQAPGGKFQNIPEELGGARKAAPKPISAVKPDSRAPAAGEFRAEFRALPRAGSCRAAPPKAAQLTPRGSRAPSADHGTRAADAAS